MPWGKFSGYTLDEIPLSYLAWCFEEATLRPPLDDLIREEIATRIGALTARPALPAPPPDVAPAVRVLVKAGFRALTRERHPDVGGTDRAMREAIAAKEWLERVVA